MILHDIYVTSLSLHVVLLLFAAGVLPKDEQAAAMLVLFLFSESWPVIDKLSAHASSLVLSLLFGGVVRLRKQFCFWSGGWLLAPHPLLRSKHAM